MLKLLKDIDAHRELLGILVVRNLKIRYKRSVLGFLWTLLTPLFFILIYSTFLKLLNSFEDKPLFLPGLVTGIIIWQFHAMCVGDSLHAILGNANLVTKTAFPRAVLPLSTVLANTINFLLSLVILIIYLGYLAGATATPISFQYVGMVPLVIVSQMALCLGISLILSCVNVYFRDTEQIVGVALLAWFFLTPIIYPFERIPLRFQRLAFLNPLTGIVVSYKSAFMGTSLMAENLVLMSIGIGWLTLFVGLAFFQKVQGSLAEEI